MRFALVFAATALLFTRVSRADTYQFTFTGQGVNTFSFALPSSPTPDSTSVSTGYSFPYFIFNNVSDIRNGVAKNELIEFDSGESIDFNNAYGQGIYNDEYYGTGPALFTSSVSAPTFVLGTYFLEDYAYDGFVDMGGGILTITDTSAVTPEPSGLALLGTGVLGTAAMSRRLRPRFNLRRTSMRDVR